MDFDCADGRLSAAFILVILRHERRRLISLSAAEWIARQITDAFLGTSTRLHDRDRDGPRSAVTKRLAAMGIRDHDHTEVTLVMGRRRD
jgi:hypothetical protein